MAYLTAARGTVDAAVAYHGGDTESYLGEAKSITTPLLMHLGEEDEFISKDAQARIKTALAGKRRVEVLSYAGCHHAFASHGGRHYAPAAAALANARTWEFLDQPTTFWSARQPRNALKSRPQAAPTVSSFIPCGSRWKMN